MNSDGSGQVNLTNNPARDGDSAWSPDGSKIAFTSNRDGNFEVYVMNADGTGQTRLTNAPGSDSAPDWSPDGSKIAFRSARDGNSEIYVMNADGTDQTRLTNNPAFDFDPTWSPDGSKIGFRSDRDGNFEIYVMNADGTDAVNISNNPASDIQQYWSPDGTKIVFTSNRDGQSEVYVMNADGTGQTRLTNNPSTDHDAIWSPDGTKIAFTSNRDGNFEIYVMNADGTVQTRLTNNPADDHEPSWGISPNISEYPIAHMQDTTSTFGLSTHSGRQIHAEFVSPSSQLTGKSIDQITLKLRKAGSPTGIAEIGVFNEDLLVKKLFGTVNASALPTIYTDFTFNLSNDELYTIEAGDRIGIKFTGGSSANSVAVMTDQDPADPFDGLLSYHQYYTTLWTSFVDSDLYMILVQTHDGIDTTPSYPITHMSDTTSSFGLSTHSGRQAHVEYVSDSSQLIGDKIDTIIMKVRKGGSPTGTAEIGVFNTDLSVKKLFGTLDAAALVSTYSDYTFVLDGSDLYEIEAGDRIGIKYADGSNADFVAVMIDNNSADPFDGASTHRQHYTTSWQSFTSEDMYMVLVQSHE